MSESEKFYFVWINDKSHGPVTASDIHSMFRQRTVTIDTFVAEAGGNDWRQLSTFPDLIPISAPAITAPPTAKHPPIHGARLGGAIAELMLVVAPGFGFVLLAYRDVRNLPGGVSFFLDCCFFGFACFLVGGIINALVAIHDTLNRK